MKHIILLLISIPILAFSQTKNSFLDREFWKTNPTVNIVEQKISEGNSATQLNPYGFDGVVYALLENADNAVIKHLLTKKGNDVNKLTHDGRTYIFWAAYKNNLDIVNHLLNNKAKTDVIDDKGYSILNFAATAGVQNPELYDVLITNGADVINDKTPKGANALLLIIPNLKDFKMVDYFTNKGLDINSTDKDGNGVFNYTAQKGNREMLQMLIDKKLPYKTLNKKGGNAMLFATRGSRRGYNSLDFFKYLEGLGVNANITNNDGLTPLHNLAYSNKDLASLQYFIDKGIDVNQTNVDGNTALINASSRNTPEVIKLLASLTDNINHKNNDGKTALTNALRNSPEVVSFLIEKGADASIIDKKGNNLAYHLVKTYNPKSKDDFFKKLKLLEAKGVNISTSQKNGNTLHHLAIKQKSIPLVELAKSKNININTKNSNGLSPLQLAVMTAKNETLIKTLIKHGADTNVKTEFEETLLDLAKENEALKNSSLDFLK